MKLTVVDSSGVIDRSFAVWLTSQVKALLIKNLKLQKLQKWDEFLTTSEEIDRLYSKRYFAYDVIEQGIQSLMFRFVNPTSFEIYINPNTLVKGYKQWKLESACKLINYGNLEVSAVPVFTSVFERVQENINEYAKTYYNVWL